MSPIATTGFTLGAYKALIAVGIIAWNLALIPEDEREEGLAEALRGNAVPDPDMLRNLARTLCWRKDELFPNDKRLVVSHTVTPIPTGYYLAVVFSHSA